MFNWLFFPIYDRLHEIGLLSTEGTPWDWFMVTMVGVWLGSPMWLALYVIARGSD